MWKLLAGAAGVGLLAFALWLGITRYGKAEYARGRADLAVEVAGARAEGEALAADAFERGVAHGQQASLGFIRWRDGPLRKVTERVNHEIIRYRASPAGRAVCLDADGLRTANQSIAAIAATAFPADPSGSPDPVQPPPDDPAVTRWNGNTGRSDGANGERGDGFGGLRDEAEVADHGLAEIE
jgi:hypothetical protein